MPDLLAGTVVNALDTPPTVQDTENGNFTITNTSYGITTSGGTYVDCGVAFVAPTTGRVMVFYNSQMDNDTAGQFTAISPVIRAGGTVGAGAVFLAAADTRALVQSGTDVFRVGASELITGLTPGSTYNVRLEHKVGGNTGTLERRHVVVAPAT